MFGKVLLIVLICTFAAGSHIWEKEEEKHASQPYRFGYEIKDKDGNQYRHEEADGHGSVKGSYGYTDEKGIYREVHYVADKNGFRAKVKTNEPGTANQNPADVKIEADPQIHHIHDVKVIPEIVPVYHKIDAAPIRPIKQYHKFDTKNYNVQNFSPLHGFRYSSSPVTKHRSSFKVGNSYRQNNGKQVGSYKFHVPHYRNLQGSSSYGKADGFKFDDEEIEKMIEDLKSKGRYSSNQDGYSGDDVIEKIMEELKNKGGYSGINRGYNNNNDFKFEEFRDLNSNKYKNLFSKDYLNDDFDQRY